MVLIEIKLELKGEDINLGNLPTDIVDNIVVKGIDDEKKCFHLGIRNSKSYAIYYDKQYELWYINLLEKYHASFIANKVDEISLFYNIFYSNQCNIEIFDKSILKRLAEFEISIPLSCYELSVDEIIKLLKKAGYSDVEIEGMRDHF